MKWTGVQGKHACVRVGRLFWYLFLDEPRSLHLPITISSQGARSAHTLGVSPMRLLGQPAAQLPGSVCSRSPSRPWARRCSRSLLRHHQKLCPLSAAPAPQRQRLEPAQPPCTAAVHPASHARPQPLTPDRRLHQLPPTPGIPRAYTTSCFFPSNTSAPLRREPADFWFLKSLSCAPQRSRSTLLGRGQRRGEPRSSRP